MAIEEIKSEAEISDGTVMLYFTAVWCGPCKMLGPVMVSFADKYDEQVDVLKVDVDEAPALAEKYEVRGVPTLVLIKDGEVVHRSTGAKPLPGLEKEFGEFI